MINKNKKEIVIAGWEGSGSTLLYQISDLLGIKTKKIHGKRSLFENQLTFFTYRDPRDSIISNARRKYKKIWDNKSPEEAIMKELGDFIKRKHPQNLYASLKMKNVILIRYEDYFLKNEEFLISLIANQFLIPLSEADRKKILEETSLKKNLDRSKNLESFKKYDSKTKIHGSHISNMGKSKGWKQYFTPQLVAVFKKELGQLLIDLGYEKDLNWK